MQQFKSLAKCWVKKNYLKKRLMWFQLTTGWCTSVHLRTLMCLSLSVGLSAPCPTPPRADKSLSPKYKSSTTKEAVKQSRSHWEHVWLNSYDKVGLHNIRFAIIFLHCCVDCVCCENDTVYIHIIPIISANLNVVKKKTF